MPVFKGEIATLGRAAGSPVHRRENAFAIGGRRPSQLWIVNIGGLGTNGLKSVDQDGC